MIQVKCEQRSVKAIGDEEIYRTGSSESDSGEAPPANLIGEWRNCSMRYDVFVKMPE